MRWVYKCWETINWFSCRNEKTLPLPELRSFADRNRKLIGRKFPSCSAPLVVSIGIAYQRASIKEKYCLQSPKPKIIKQKSGFGTKTILNKRVTLPSFRRLCMVCLLISFFATATWPSARSFKTHASSCYKAFSIFYSLTMMFFTFLKFVYTELVWCFKL